MLGMTREEYLLKYGPDEARQAIIDLRAHDARQEEGGQPEPVPTADLPHERKEPPPQEGLTLVWPTAQKRFGGMLDHQVGVGYRKYGTYLRTFNGRDAYGDFLAEQVDGLMYATQLYLEAQTFVDLTDRAVALLEEARTYVLYHTFSRASEDELLKRLGSLIKETKACLEKSGLSRSQNQHPT